MAKTRHTQILALAVAVLMTAMLLPTAALAAGTGYSDVAPDAEYAEAVAFMLANGYMNGTGDGKFSPDVELSRAMAVTVLYRMAGEPEAKEKAAFSDVEDGTWYTDAVYWAAENGITKGTGDGKFSPDRSLTDVEASILVSRFEELQSAAPAENQGQQGGGRGGKGGPGGQRITELTEEEAAAKLKEAEDPATDKETAKNDYKTLAEVYQKGSDKEGYVKKDLDKALTYFLKAGEFGDSLSYVNAGDIVLEKGDKDTAITYYEKGSEGGNPKGYRNIGQLCEKDGDYEKALTYYNKALELNDVSSSAYIGKLYEDGKLGKADLEKAAEYYLKAIAPKNYGAGGVKDALYSLANFYENGLGGLKKSIGKAADLYSLAADNGKNEAKSELARIYAAAETITRSDFAVMLYDLMKTELPEISVENTLYGEGCTIGTTEAHKGENFTTLKAEEDGKILYAEDSKAVITFGDADVAKLDLSGAKVTLGEGDGYYTYDYKFTGGTLVKDEQAGKLTLTLDSDDLTYNNEQGYTVDNGGLEWSAQGGDGGGRYYFNLILSGVKYDGVELAPERIKLKIYIYGREFSARSSPMGASNSRWGAGNFNDVVLPVAEEKALENKPVVSGEPVWTWVGDNSIGKPILCDYNTDDFYISWPSGVDASAIADKDVKITLTSKYGDEKVLTANTKVKTDPEDVKFIPDGEYSVYSSKDTTQISVNLVHWAYTPVYTKMTIEVNGASKTYDVGSVYQYSLQMGGGLDYDKTVTVQSLFGIKNIEDFTSKQLIPKEFAYTWVFRARSGMGAPTLIYVEHEDGTYETVKQAQGGGGMGPGGMGAQAPNPAGSEFPSDADVRFVGHSVYRTNHADTKMIVVHTDDPDFAEFDGKEVAFTKSYNFGMGPLGSMDKNLPFVAEDGYVDSHGNYGSHMNWAWADFALGDAHGWINPDFVPAQQGQGGGQQQGGGQH